VLLGASKAISAELLLVAGKAISAEVDEKETSGFIIDVANFEGG